MDRKIKAESMSQIRRLKAQGALSQIDELQARLWLWQKTNFGDRTTGNQLLLGVSEEVGELCHAQLKGEQGIRHSPEEILEMKKDAIGDIFVFLCNYCSQQGLNFEECINQAWEEIKTRNWKKEGQDDK